MENEKMIVVEKNCCFDFKNPSEKGKPKRFCSGGAFISEKYVIAYLSCDGKKITDWHGHVLSETFQKLGERETTYGKGFYMRFKLNGKVYSGFCLGEGGIIKARLTKRTEI